MIYIYTGNDIKNKNISLKKLCNDSSPIFLRETEFIKEEILNYAKSVSLFGGIQTIVIEDLIKSGDISFSKEDIISLKESENLFILIEEKLLAADSKKYKDHSIIKDFNTTVIKKNEKINVFDIADSFSKRDKMNTWILYRDAVLNGIPSEEISGIIFWKVKTMILNGSKYFSLNELKKISGELVSLYHESHKGNLDFVIGLEQLILSSLSKQKEKA